MRMVIGLGGILVTIGVIAWIMGKSQLPYNQAVIEAGQKADVTLNQISGRDANGNNINTTYTVFADTRGDGKIQDLQITRLTPDSPLASFFGLQENDVVIAGIDGHGVRTDINGIDDETDARMVVWNAYTGGGELIVQRGDQTLTLPQAKTQVTNARNSNPQPAAQQGQQDRANSSESQQMEDIRHRITLPGF